MTHEKALSKYCQLLIQFVSSLILFLAFIVTYVECIYRRRICFAMVVSTSLMNFQLGPYYRHTIAACKSFLLCQVVKYTNFFLILGFAHHFLTCIDVKVNTMLQFITGKRI